MDGVDWVDKADSQVSCGQSTTRGTRGSDGSILGNPVAVHSVPNKVSPCWLRLDSTAAPCILREIRAFAGSETVLRETVLSETVLRR